MKIQTSLWFSKKLNDAGFKGESEMWWKVVSGDYSISDKMDVASCYQANNVYPAYDILNDLCVKYTKELFGDDALNKENDLKIYEIMRYL